MLRQKNIPNEISEKICFFCKKKIGEDRISYNNAEIAAFIMMPANNSAHLECYTKNIILDE